MKTPTFFDCPMIINNPPLMSKKPQYFSSSLDENKQTTVDVMKIQIFFDFLLRINSPLLINISYEYPHRNAITEYLNCIKPYHRFVHSETLSQSTWIALRCFIDLQFLKTFKIKINKSIVENKRRECIR